MFRYFVEGKSVFGYNSDGSGVKIAEAESWAWAQTIRDALNDSEDAYHAILDATKV